MSCPLCLAAVSVKMNTCAISLFPSLCSDTCRDLAASTFLLLVFGSLCLCPDFASSWSLGCKGQESFLSPAHAVLLAHEATEPERSEVGMELGARDLSSVSQQPAPRLASPWHGQTAAEHKLLSLQQLPANHPSSSPPQGAVLGAGCLPLCAGDG